MEAKASPRLPTLEQQREAVAREPSLTSLSNSFDQLIRDHKPGFFKTSDFDEAMNNNSRHGNSKFVFGSSTSAFQIEGGSEYVDKEWGSSVWDEFAKKNGFFDTHGQDAVNHTLLFREDIQMMKDMGFDAYRFSISWPRIFPDGRGPKDDPDAKGIRFYKDLLDGLHSAGIKAFVTLFHWDTPSALEQLYRGWLFPLIVDDFANYAQFCFETFGDKVDKWITLNEPFGVAFFAYMKNWHAPGYGDNYVFPPMGPHTDSSKHQFPYLATHFLLLAHAQAVKRFREYKAKNSARANQEIGVTLNSKWFLPYDPKKQADVNAASRALDFYFGWYLDPLVHGRYPESMEQFTIKFSQEDKDLIIGSFDFIGINYYTSQFVTHKEDLEGNHYEAHQKLKASENGLDSNGKPITIGDERGASSWLISHPTGIKNLLLHIKEKYNNPVIYITENGIDDHNFDHKGTMTKHWAGLFDEKRLSYIRDHLQNVLEAMRAGVNVRGYFTWSLLDNFEWNNAFKVRFGLLYVDYHHPQRKRYLKLSSTWFKYCLKNGRKSDVAGATGNATSALTKEIDAKGKPTPHA